MSGASELFAASIGVFPGTMSRNGCRSLNVGHFVSVAQCMVLTQLII